MADNGRYYYPPKEPKKFNMGDWLHLVEFLVLVFTAGMMWEKMDASQAQVAVHTQQLQRIEMYLSHSDPSYWKDSR